MNRITSYFVSVFLTAISLTLHAQQPFEGAKYLLCLEDVIQLAKEQSPQSILARHRFRASYFSYEEYKATFRPKLNLSTNPTSWDKSIQTVQSFDNNDNLITKEVKANTFSSTAGLYLSQNIGLTGGSVSLGSDFSRRQNFLEQTKEISTTYTTNPVRLSLSQPLNGYNQFRWSKEIEPLRYEEAKQSYIVQMETVSANAVSNFFALAIAQVNLKMRQTNVENQKELYDISKGRYEMGLIAEDALLQVELRYMTSKSQLNSAKIEIESSLNQLRSFLGFRDNVEIELIINSEVPSFSVDFEEALNYALTRHPDILSNSRQILEAERYVAQTKSQTGISLDLDASFGLNKSGYDFNYAYQPKFGDREGISLRINVPILDWNQAKNRYRQAQSNLEVIETQIQQLETNFKQDIFLRVMSFNMQEGQLLNAAMADTIAQKSYTIAYQRYMMGKGNITDMNIADTDKDNAKIGYMNALSTYWNLYYIIRRLTLFDFLNNKPLEEDFELLMKN